MTDEYKDKLERGLQYQDFVTEKLYEKGILTITYASKKYQIKYGENKAGIEIKFDDKCKRTGNLYIEISEKSNKNNPYFVDSGIYRDDNTWLFIIGDYSNIYILSKIQLQKVHREKKFIEINNETSNGFLLPISYAKEQALIIKEILVE